MSQPEARPNPAARPVAVSRPRARSAHSRSSTAGGLRRSEFCGFAVQTPGSAHPATPPRDQPRRIPSHTCFHHARGCGSVSSHSSRVGRRPSRRACRTQSVWACRRRDESPSGVMSRCSVRAGRRSSQSGHRYTEADKFWAGRIAHQCASWWDTPVRSVGALRPGCRRSRSPNRLSPPSPGNPLRVPGRRS